MLDRRRAGIPGNARGGEAVCAGFPIITTDDTMAFALIPALIDRAA